ncbi:MAG: ABC transporter substrate-binding protein [Burkholderiaceae bacterium]
MRRAGAAGSARRAALRSIALGTLGSLASLRSRATPRDSRTYHVGILRHGLPPLALTEIQHQGPPKALAELGYVEGRNLILERRYTDGDAARLPALARELVRARVDAIVAVTEPAIVAAKVATTKIPIVMFGNFDPVALGLVTDLARPDGNVTGVLIAPDGTLAGKRLELLLAMLPHLPRVGLLVPARYQSVQAQIEETRRAATQLGVDLVVVEVEDGDYARAFDVLVAQRCGALLVGTHSFFVRDRKQIIDLATKHVLPAMYEWREQVVDGGLMSYSTNLYGLYQRLAAQLDRLFNGAAPRDIPVERPARFDLVVNRATARRLGLEIPAALRLRIDEIIE